MIAYLLIGVGFAIVSVGLIWSLPILVDLVYDGHRRGIARVQRGQSWQPKGRL